jgi:aquaporin Z
MPVNKHEMLPKYSAEFVGTFFLVLTVGCDVHTGSIGAAISIGAILMVMVYALGSVSGAHFNPAVTIAIGLSGRGKITGHDMFGYIISQCAGGFIAGLTYLSIFDDAFLLSPQDQAYNLGHVLCVEILYSAALCYVVLNVATTHNKAQGNCEDSGIINSFYGLAIGLTVTSAAIAIGPISGCSLNPALSFGSLWARKFAFGKQPFSLWAVYCLAPIIGAALASLLFFFVQGGLTGQFEYPSGGSPVSSPRPPSVLLPRQPYKKKTQYLNTNDCVEIPEQVEGHKLVFGMSWETSTSDSTVDFDASCATFGSDGERRRAFYFADPFGQGQEDPTRSQSSRKRYVEEKDPIIRHQGDNVTGAGAGLSGMLRNKAKKDDAEQIVVNSLARLRKEKPRETYLFFYVNVWSSGKNQDELLSNLKGLSIRLMDADDDSFVLCQFQKQDLKKAVNGFIMGVLFWKEERWMFKVLDESAHVERHSTFRAFDGKCSSIVKSLEGSRLASP